MELHTLQLSYRPSRHRVPQVVKIAFWGFAAWVFFAFLVWLVGLAV